MSYDLCPNIPRKRTLHYNINHGRFFKDQALCAGEVPCSGRMGLPQTVGSALYTVASDNPIIGKKQNKTNKAFEENNIQVCGHHCPQYFWPCTRNIGSMIEPKMEC